MFKDIEKKENKQVEKWSFERQFQWALYDWIISVQFKKRSREEKMGHDVPILSIFRRFSKLDTSDDDYVIIGPFSKYNSH